MKINRKIFLISTILTIVSLPQIVQANQMSNVKVEIADLIESREIKIEKAPCNNCDTLKEVSAPQPTSTPTSTAQPEPITREKNDPEVNKAVIAPSVQSNPVEIIPSPTAVPTSVPASTPLPVVSENPKEEQSSGILNNIIQFFLNFFRI